MKTCPIKAINAVEQLLDCTDPRDLRQGLHKAKTIFLKYSTNEEDRDQVQFACDSLIKSLKILE